MNCIGVEQFFEILHLQTQTPPKDSTPTKGKLSIYRSVGCQV
ncbi:unnamed protein product [Coregonus sp. 'balchen']|nr:unnamed protein product [Coregonus sp. 'balchen']